MFAASSTNDSASLALHRLGSQQRLLQRSLEKLSSGQRASFQEDPGGQAVALKLKASARRMHGLQTNVQNALSFLQTQAGAFQTAASVISRMTELAASALDVTKNVGDISQYDTEFQQLQSQLSQLGFEKFNSISLFLSPSPGATPASTEEQLLSVPISPENGQSAEVSVAPLVTTPWVNMLLNGFVSFADPGNASRRIFIPNPPQDVTGYLEDGTEFNLDQTVTISQKWTERFTLSAGWNLRSATIGGAPATVSATISSPAVSAVGANTFQLNTPTNAAHVTNPTYRQLAENVRTGQFIDPLHAGTTQTSPINVNFASSNPLATLDVQTASTTLTQTLEPWSSNPVSGTAADVSSGTLSADTGKEMGVVASLALQSVAQMLAKNGAQESRLRRVHENLSTTAVETEAALSRISDVDVAAETARLAKVGILQQFSAAMLVQANFVKEKVQRALLG